MSVRPLYFDRLKDITDVLDKSDGDILLVDADIVAFRHTFLNTDTIDWGDGNVQEIRDLERARGEAIDFIDHLAEITWATHVVLCFTGKENFRYDCFPDYKSGRKEKPEMLDDLKDAMACSRSSIKHPKLEADDVLGILLSRYEDRATLASIDKDLDQVAGWHYNWNRKETYKTTMESGQKFFWTQVLTGDPTDGYKGVKGIGPKKADKILTDDVMTGTDQEIYDVVLEVYLANGHTEEYMISQINCAYMLQDHNFDLETNTMTLWEAS